MEVYEESARGYGLFTQFLRSRLCLYHIVVIRRYAVFIVLCGSDGLSACPEAGPGKYCLLEGW